MWHLEGIIKVAALPPGEQPTIPPKESTDKAQRDAGHLLSKKNKKMRFNTTRTATTLNTSMMPWSWPSMGLSPLAHHHHLLLTGHLYSLRRIPSWSHEWNISSTFKLLQVTSRGDQQFLVIANHRIRHSESDQFPFQWKGTWIKFHLCWSLQGKRASPITEVHQAFTIHVAVGGHFSKTQRWLHCLPLKKGKQAIMQQSPRDSTASHHWEDTCKSPPQPLYSVLGR